MHCKYIFLPAVIFLLFLPQAALPQDTKKLNLTEIYDFDSLSPFSSSISQTSETENCIALSAEYFGKQLFVKAVIKPDWHLYSATQPDDGTIPSEFKFDLQDNELLEIKPDKPPVQKNAAGFSVPLEEHSGTVTWLLTFRNDLPQAVSGNLYCQLCMDGPEGVCLPPKDFPFEAVEIPETKFAASLQAFKDVPPQFIWKKDNLKEDSGKETFNYQEKYQEKLSAQELTPVSGSAVALLYAFLGGIILNFMPCVLPVIGLKILSFFEQAGKSRSRALMLNISYSAGLLSVFLVLAFLSCGLSILFTFDIFNILMACIVFMMALSLMDVWEISLPSFFGSGTSVKITQQEGFTGAFFKGIITTLLAIPCGAPLLSPAVNWADMQTRSGNTPLVFLAYSVIGLGMASPYLIMGAFPEMLRFLPKPGQWMETFKKTMGFFLLIAVVWILYFIQTERILPSVAVMFALWFACWFCGRLDYTAKSRQRIFTYAVSLAVVLAVLLCSFNMPVMPHWKYTLENAMTAKIYGHTGRHWIPYTPEAFDKALHTDKLVLVDFTADWCVNCKVLEQFVLYSDDVIKVLDKERIISFTADCTREGDAKEFLRKFGADQVPVLAVFRSDEPDKPLVIRGGYTKKTLLDIIAL